MWLAISNREISEPYFHPSKSLAINTEIYIKRVLTTKDPTIYTQTSWGLQLSILA